MALLARSVLCWGLSMLAPVLQLKFGLRIVCRTINWSGLRLVGGRMLVVCQLLPSRGAGFRLASLNTECGFGNEAQARTFIRASCQNDHGPVALVSLHANL